MNKKLLFQHIVTTMSRQGRLLFATSLILTACAFVISAMTIFNSNLNRILTLWGEDIQMSVYLQDDASTDQILAVQKNLSENNQIGKFEFINQERAMQDFRTQLSQYAPDLSNDKDLMKIIPASFQLSLNTEISASQQLSVMTELSNIIKTWSGVDEVSFGQDWIEKFSSITEAAKNSGSILSILVLVCSIFVISNSVQSSIHSRRTEIEILELIGATQRDIRIPYLIESAALGFLCTAMGVGLAFAGFTFTKEKLLESAVLMQIGQHVSFLSISTVLLFCLAGACVGAMAALICLRRINRGWAAASK